MNTHLISTPATPVGTTHQGVERVQEGLAAMRDVAQSTGHGKGLATALMGALVATLVVFADRMIDAWADEHLFAAWVLMWALVFGALGMFSGVMRRAARALQSGYKAWQVRRTEEAADERMWQIAQNDPRIMAELRLAQLRARPEADAAYVAQAMAQFQRSADTARGTLVSDEYEAQLRRRGHVLALRPYL
jgi:hypothetical protein